MIHLDTSFLIRALVVGSGPDHDVRSWLSAGHELAMTAVAWSEFLCGPLNPDDLRLAKNLVSDRTALEEGDAELAARFYNETGRRRGSLVDCMIAASAVRRQHPLATLNVDDFRRFEPLGLRFAVSLHD